MAKKCEICGKGSRIVQRRVKLRGKYNPTVKRRVYPNLQSVKIPENIKKQAYKKFAGKKVLACTKCIKGIGKKK
jgi:ribosomal protein L28